MKTGAFLAVNDEVLSGRIINALHRVVFVAPSISLSVANALGTCFERADRVLATVITDPDDNGYRLGYGEPDGLKQLYELAAKHQIALRAQAGLRVGLLIVDESVLIWAPIPAAVESPREGFEANGVDLGTETRSADPYEFAGDDSVTAMVSSPTEFIALADRLALATAADGSKALITDADIGGEPLTPEMVEETIKSLTDNPPEPFDLSRKTRVFSSKFQYAEVELRGAEWTSKEIKLSSVLMNIDAEASLRDLFETKFRPYAHMEDVAVEVQRLVEGQLAFNAEGKPIRAPLKQSEIEKLWKELKKRYLTHMPGFGWLIRRKDKQKFEAEVKAYDGILQEWVKGFRLKVAAEDANLINRISKLVIERARGIEESRRPSDQEIREMVAAGIERMRIIEPKVRMVFKEVSWESTRDKEFTDALRKALPPEELTGWFETFTAARENTLL